MNEVSIIIPLYNEQENISQLYARLDAVSKSWNGTFEIIFVDDGSCDRSLEIIKSIAKDDKRVKYFSLSRNFGHQAAVCAGLASCTKE